ncbi:MAG: gamma carbonic anhydrase family protein [Spirochaetes bacterium]|nr:gamma carbonic anhydrase family protein [Spirochaetota bacterium]
MIKKYKNYSPEIAESAFVFESAEVIGQVSIGSRSSVWVNAVVRGDIGCISIGESSNIQDNCVIHITEGLPASIGDRVTVGHGAILHSCTVGNDCLIGMGSIILDNAVIGDNSMVGAGSLVTQGKTFPPNSLILGSPAKVVRSLTENELKNNRMSAERYASVAAEYTANKTSSKS